MGLDFDTTRAARSPSQLTALVRAVVDASEHDEANWVEWKLLPELTSAHAKFAMAKAILGMSNRSPDYAAQNCDGCAYLVVGADHTGVHGTKEIDLSSVDQGLTTYLGGADIAPSWSAQYVHLEDQAILVFTIEPPRWGDPIRPLHQGYNNFVAGQVFLRSGTKTEIADPGGIAMLQQRLVKGAASPAMQLLVRPNVSYDRLFRTPRLDSEAADAWLAEERQRLLAKITPESLAPSRRGEVPGSFRFIAAAQPRALSLKKNTALLDTYLAECRQILPLFGLRLLTKSPSNKLTVRVENTTDSTISGARVTIWSEQAGVSFVDGPPDGSKMPKEPNWASYESLVSAVDYSHLLNAIPRAARPLRLGVASVTTHNGFPAAAWNLGDLRPDQHEEGEPVTISIDLEGPVRLHWLATATNRNGRATEEFTVDISDDPFDFSDVDEDD